MAVAGGWLHLSSQGVPVLEATTGVGTSSSVLYIMSLGMFMVEGAAARGGHEV